MLVKVLKPDFFYKDDRGSITQLVHKGWNQVNVITSVSGALRGGHYHKLNDEAFYVIGGKLRLVLKSNDREEEQIFNAGDMFQIEKNIWHSFEFLEDTKLVSLYSVGVELENGLKDIYE